jgi:hypothetical protein
MSSKRHHPHKGGTTPTTEPKDRLGVVQFSVSEVAQFSMSLDTLEIFSDRLWVRWVGAQALARCVMNCWGLETALARRSFSPVVWKFTS